MAEHRLEGAPGEKIRMNYLIGIPAQDEILVTLKASENKLKLDIGYVLYFIDNNKIVCLLRILQIIMSQNVGIVTAVLFQKDEVFLK